MIPIILMGGRATRLPYKIFLSTRQGKPLFTSALDACLKCYSNPPVLCVASEYAPIVKEMITSLGFAKDHDIQIHVDNYVGLPTVLDHYLTLDSISVWCGDNVYGHQTVQRVLELGDASFAAAKIGTRPGEELDGYREGQWLYRTKMQDNDLRLTTPWALPKGSLRDPTLCGGSVLDVLNEKQVKPAVFEDSEWRDLGTLQAVEDYYAN